MNVKGQNRERLVAEEAEAKKKKNRKRRCDSGVSAAVDPQGTCGRGPGPATRHRGTAADRRTATTELHQEHTGDCNGIWLYLRQRRTPDHLVEKQPQPDEPPQTRHGVILGSPARPRRQTGRPRRPRPPVHRQERRRRRQQQDPATAGGAVADSKRVGRRRHGRRRRGRFRSFHRPWRQPLRRHHHRRRRRCSASERVVAAAHGPGPGSGDDAGGDAHSDSGFGSGRPAPAALDLDERIGQGGGAVRLAVDEVHEDLEELVAQEAGRTTLRRHNNKKREEGGGGSNIRRGTRAWWSRESMRGCNDTGVCTCQAQGTQGCLRNAAYSSEHCRISLKLYESAPRACRR